MPIASEFLNVSAFQMEQSLGRIETCLSQLTAEQVWTRYGENQNAVGNLVLHLTGNVRQWILSGLGGERDTRTRDVEFSTRGPVPGSQLKDGLAATVQAAITVIQGLSEQELLERITVQGYDVTKLEAIYHVVEHFSGHTFQIIFATKLLTGADLGFYAHLAPSASADNSV